jgi:hypothetical protein
MVPRRLSVVTIAAGGLASLRKFYSGLGWPELDGSDDNWAAYLLGGVVLAIYPKAELDQEATPAEGGPGGFTLAMNVDREAQVDEVFHEACSKGARALAEPQDRPWGGRSGYIADPEGNRWEIAWNPGVVIGPAGEVASFGTG